MITRKELQEIAKIKSLSLGNAEKDYLLDIALLGISRHTKNELVFKGGTCLYKFYKLNRFSEDLDFSKVEKIDFGKLIQALIIHFRRFGINASQHKIKEPYNSILITLRLIGPLFTGNSASYAKIGIDINMKSSVIIPAQVLSHKPIYPEIPAMQLLCMAPEEIFAEKVRAILTRKRARDLFDLHFMLTGNSSSEKEIICKKLDYYNEKFSLNKLILRIKELKPYWKKELTGLVSYLPDFEKICEETINSLREIF